MKKRYWRIEAFDSSDRIFHIDVAVSSYTDRQIQRLLQTLAAKNGLSDREIVEASGKRGHKFQNGLLEVRREGQSSSYSCGDNPHFNARVVERAVANETLQ